MGLEHKTNRLCNLKMSANVVFWYWWPDSSNVSWNHHTYNKQQSLQLSYHYQVASSDLTWDWASFRSFGSFKGIVLAKPFRVKSCVTSWYVREHYEICGINVPTTNRFKEAQVCAVRTCKPTTLVIWKTIFFLFDNVVRAMEFGRTRDTRYEW